MEYPCLLQRSFSMVTYIFLSRTKISRRCFQSSSRNRVPVDALTSTDEHMSVSCEPTFTGSPILTPLLRRIRKAGRKDGQWGCFQQHHRQSNVGHQYDPVFHTRSRNQTLSEDKMCCRRGEVGSASRSIGRRMRNNRGRFNENYLLRVRCFPEKQHQHGRKV